MLYRNPYQDFYTATLQTIFTPNCSPFAHAIDICGEPPWRCHSYAKDDRVKQARVSGQKPASALPGTSPYHLLLHKRLDRGKKWPFPCVERPGLPPQKVSRLAKCLSPKYFSFPATWIPPHLAPCRQVLNFCALKFIWAFWSLMHVGSGTGYKDNIWILRRMEHSTDRPTFPAPL